jgi:hypothetical protein
VTSFAGDEELASPPPPNVQVPFAAQLQTVPLQTQFPTQFAWPLPLSDVVASGPPSVMSVAAG